jgi:thioesterase domain-containing protein
VTLFRATDIPEWIHACRRDPALGWKPFARNLQLLDTPGSHYTMLYAPQAEALAPLLRPLL